MKKIIEIMSHPPVYDVYNNKPRPKINWDLPDGNWVGIWGYDGANLIGFEVKKVKPDIEFEVWQPDLRADKIYSHRFDEGLVHKLIPANSKKILEGIKLTETIYSVPLKNELDRVISKEKDVVLVLDGTPMYFNIDLYKNYYKKIPIVSSFSGDPKIYFNHDNTKNPLKLLHRKLIIHNISGYFKIMKNAMVGNIPSSVELLNNFGITVHTNLIGIDFNIWSKDKTKSESRDILKIPKEPFVIFSSSRLNRLKQVDRLIDVLSKLKEYDFICYISGHGLREYEKYLKDLIDKHNLSKKIHLTGYITEEELKYYYLASDLFVTTSMAEGGPVSAWKALALETPVFTTNTGNVIAFLNEYNAGVIVDIDNYKEWERKLRNILQGEKVTIIARDEVENFASWKNVAKRYLNIYKEAFDKFYRRN